MLSVVSRNPPRPLDLSNHETKRIPGILGLPGILVPIPGIPSLC